MIHHLMRFGLWLEEATLSPRQIGYIAATSGVQGSAASAREGTLRDNTALYKSLDHRLIISYLNISGKTLNRERARRPSLKG